MKEVCVGCVDVERVTASGIPYYERIIATCKYLNKCPKAITLDPTQINKPKKLEECKYYRKYERRRANEAVLRKT